jgi:hypothetical protein
MSLTSYRAAPPRANDFKLPRSSPEASCFPFREAERWRAAPPRAKQKRRRELGLDGGDFNIANGLLLTPPAKPGDDLLFHCLSSSTIGAVRFHGRVRDGVGWVTDAMATKLWDRRFEVLEIVHLGFVLSVI